jgi:membrane protease YdiL (CAAX protease family)
MPGVFVDWFDRYHHFTRTTATAALTTVPLVLLYGVGLLAASEGARSAVDLVTAPLLAAVPRPSYIGVQLAIGGILIFVAAFRRESRFGAHVAWVVPALAESVAWSLVTGGLVLAALDEIHVVRVVALEVAAGSSGLPTAAPAPTLSWIDLSVLSAGAGLYEELVFRLLLIPVLTAALARGLGLERWGAVVGAVLLSSVIFSAAHHFAGEAFDSYVFAYRAVAGLFFAALFALRGFAIAAWTHAIYDFQILAHLSDGG